MPNGAGDNMVHLASGGCVKFSFNALPSTSVEFAFEVMAPSAADGYLCISIESAVRCSGASRRVRIGRGKHARSNTLSPRECIL